MEIPRTTGFLEIDDPDKLPKGTGCVNQTKAQTRVETIGTLSKNLPLEDEEINKLEL
ncbi:MAG: hypothetical protein WCI36_00670 [bacterium]